MQRIAKRIAALGWHIVIYFEHADLDEMAPFLKSLPTTLVFDHMGVPNVAEGVNGKAFQNWLKAIDANKTWINKVTCPERFTLAGPPYDDVVPFARTIVERFPGPRALGHRLAASQHEERGAGRRRAHRHDPEDRADGGAAAGTAHRQSDAALLGAPIGRMRAVSRKNGPRAGIDGTFGSRHARTALIAAAESAKRCQHTVGEYGNGEFGRCT